MFCVKDHPHYIPTTTPFYVRCLSIASPLRPPKKPRRPIPTIFDGIPPYVTIKSQSWMRHRRQSGGRSSRFKHLIEDTRLRKSRVASATRGPTLSFGDILNPGGFVEGLPINVKTGSYLYLYINIPHLYIYIYYIYFYMHIYIYIDDYICTCTP